ncbi:uncharacterized [Tachysurus ichikawai]
MRCRDDTKRRVAYRDLRPLVLDPVIAARVEGAGRLALRHHDDMACCTLCDLEDHKQVKFLYVQDYGY